MKKKSGECGGVRTDERLRVDMPFPIKTCVVCEEQFELKPGKPGFANRCPKCSVEDEDEEQAASDLDAGDPEANAARRKAIRDLLYRKET